MSSKHTITTTFAKVRASDDAEWLWARAGECGCDPADDDACPNCLAYVRAQQVEDARGGVDRRHDAMSDERTSGDPEWKATAADYWDKNEPAPASERTSGGVSEARTAEIMRWLRWWERGGDPMGRMMGCPEGYIDAPTATEILALLSSAPAERDEQIAALQADNERLREVIAEAYGGKKAKAMARRLSSVHAPQRRPASDGAARIAAERQRQTEREGWTPEHDDEHNGGEIAGAAHSYVEAAYQQIAGALAGSADIRPSKYWSWPGEWKPTADPIRNLEKAGALIAAEIDRLLRLGIAAASEPQRDGKAP